MSPLLLAIYIICGIYMVLNFKRDIQMLQQNSYRISRYWHWLDKNMVNTWRLFDVVMLFMLFSTLVPYNIAATVIAIVCLGKIAMILRKRSKKPLVFTKRVWRIYSVTAVLAVAAVVLLIIFDRNSETTESSYICLRSLPLGVLLLITVFSWFPVILSVWILTPVEAIINRRYYNDAARILRAMPDLTVIGITGSYGKTSTKHYLYRILCESYDVLMTPGSYNTPMGVIRTIREMMKPYNQIFICEMGAKQKGDVKEICDLVHPQIGVITAVGPMHLESFKTIENVQRTKFELADSLPADGLAVINNDFEYCANRPVDNVPAIRYSVGRGNIADFHAVDIVYSAEGTSFAVEGPDGLRIDLRTQLVGECNISNLTGAVAVACYLGVPHDKIRYAVAHIQQVEHRLSIRRSGTGVTIIDDAFNSNPTGSRMAVDVLSQFNTGKRIIVTPGMIELGAEQSRLNFELGEYFADKVDVAIVVGHYNRDAICGGALKGGIGQENLLVAESFSDAQKILSKMLRSGDTVLYENDLPDTFK